MNIPIALITLALIAVSKPSTEYRPARMDYRGLVLIASGVALSVFGFQQSGTWGWTDARTLTCVIVGVALLAAFALVETRTASPLIEMSILGIRPFLVENIVLGIAMLVFIPVFFFSSEYAQISLGKSPSNASLILLYFFLGFVVASQIGGRMIDRRGAKLPVVLGCIVAALGFLLWAGKLTGLDLKNQVSLVILSGAGLGFMVTPASTDAVNRASKYSYGEATGITQTVRNYSASLGIAILGSLFVTQLHSRLVTSFVAQGLPRHQADVVASRISQSRQGSGVSVIPHFVRLDFAYATRSVFHAMAGIMAAAAIVAIVGLRRGTQLEPALESAPDEALA